MGHIGQNCLFQMLASVEQQIKERGPEWIVVWELLLNPFVRKNAPVLLVIATHNSNFLTPFDL